MTNTVFIGLGSNVGNKLFHLQKSKELIESKIGKIVSCSSIYETEPWGFASEQSFLNQAIKIETQNSALEILNVISEIELSMGRIRTDNQYISRTIDIDILFFNDEIINEANLSVPHPRIAERQFVLMPLFEIAREFVHPILQKTIMELKVECDDEGKVVVYRIGD